MALAVSTFSAFVSRQIWNYEWYFLAEKLGSVILKGGILPIPVGGRAPSGCQLHARLHRYAPRTHGILCKSAMCGCTDVLVAKAEASRPNGSVAVRVPKGLILAGAYR